MAAISIFKKLGFVRKVTLSGDDSKNHSFITIVSNDDFKKVITGYAPATGITVQQKVDFALTKSLDKNFLIAAFGDNPVMISISGLHIYCDECSMEGADKTIVEFYKENKVSSDVTKRVQIGIAGKGGERGQTFECAVIGCDLTADSKSIEYGASNYKLSLIGVEI